MDGAFPGFSGHTLLSGEAAENKPLMNAIAHSLERALGLDGPVFNSHSQNQF
jgi:hypothetical protein